MSNDSHIIINIGRQFGSGGKLVALEIGRCLGIQVYDSELIIKAAEESGFSKAVLKRSDEKRKFFSISTLIGGSGRLGNSHSFDIDNEIFKIQGRTIESIADKGDAVFVGRCSNYILRDRKCLDVFIKAPMEDRIKRVAEREGMSPEEAARRIERQDKTRSSYYNFFTYGKWGDSSDYDLCVDSSLLGIEGTAEVIIDFGRKAGIIR